MRYFRADRRREQEVSRFKSEVLFINRVAKVLKGGRRFRFTALVVVGDGEGSVGLGLGKAPEVVEAIRKGEELARKNMIQVQRAGTTIPYEVQRHYCATTVVLRPAREGAGITAGGPARPLLALAGVTDCTAKFLGSNNRVNCARATFEALRAIEDPAETLKRRRDRSFRIQAARADARQPEAGEGAPPAAGGPKPGEGVSRGKEDALPAGVPRPGRAPGPRTPGAGAAGGHSARQASRAAAPPERPMRPGEAAPQEKAPASQQEVQE